MQFDDTPDRSESEWLAHVSSHLLPAIKVGSPEQVAGTMMTKGYTTYGITIGDGAEVTARHRFSAFEKLHGRLTETYGTVGMLIPPLPGKDMVASGSSANVVKRRTKALTIFCESVLSNPYLRHDANWRLFSGAGADASTAFSKFVEREENVGARRWLAMLRTKHVPADLAETLACARGELTTVEAQLKGNIAAASKANASLTAFAGGLHGLHTALNAWGAVESNQVDVLNGLRGLDAGGAGAGAGAAVAADFSVPNVLNRASLLTSGVSEHLGALPDAASLLVVERLEFELKSLQALRALFATYEAARTSAATAQSKLSRAEASASTKPEAVAEARRTAEDKRANVALFAQGLVAFTLPRFVASRAVAVKSTFHHLGAVLVAAGTHLYADSDEFFHSMKISRENANHQATTALLAIGSAPLPDAGGGGLPKPPPAPAPASAPAAAAPAPAPAPAPAAAAPAPAAAPRAFTSLMAAPAPAPAPPAAPKSAPAPVPEIPAPAPAPVHAAPVEAPAPAPKPRIGMPSGLLDGDNAEDGLFVGGGAPSSASSKAATEDDLFG